ncbi:hypothetical protein LTR78_002810 [Recurvomyces mirabilis]|uniref:Uncharacterized protein n=1 Tax=Recurvomyces mirabilis TaxID=574656 RepID=A0AAE1C407_9PEZI|nr:hypothetical protein LTR78_002810 [Recurvomyces mirabilis]KAK5159457.1 hypothetical protein LTS14_002599 [Recurvomyces mirabilis]
MVYRLCPILQQNDGRSQISDEDTSCGFVYRFLVNGESNSPKALTMPQIGRREGTDPAPVGHGPQRAVIEPGDESLPDDKPSDFSRVSVTPQARHVADVNKQPRGAESSSLMNSAAQINALTEQYMDDYGDAAIYREGLFELDYGYHDGLVQRDFTGDRRHPLEVSDDVFDLEHAIEHQKITSDISEAELRYKKIGDRLTAAEFDLANLRGADDSISSSRSERYPYLAGAWAGVRDEPSTVDWTSSPVARWLDSLDDPLGHRVMNSTRPGVPETPYAPEISPFTE